MEKFYKVRIENITCKQQIHHNIMNVPKMLYWNPWLFRYTTLVLAHLYNRNHNLTNLPKRALSILYLILVRFDSIEIVIIRKRLQFMIFTTVNCSHFPTTAHALQQSIFEQLDLAPDSGMVSKMSSWGGHQV